MSDVRPDASLSALDTWAMAGAWAALVGSANVETVKIPDGPPALPQLQYVLKTLAQVGMEELPNHALVLISVGPHGIWFVNSEGLSPLAVAHMATTTAKIAIEKAMTG